MRATTLLPSLAQVEAMDTTFLREASDYWTRTADLWEQAFTDVHERSSSFIGTSWKGQAATAELERSYADMVQVRGYSYQLLEAAGIARRGGEQLEASKATVLDAVNDAEADGFEVGDDYSLTDRSQGGSAEFRAARLTLAQNHAAFIRHRVAALVANDQRISSQIAAATEEVDALTFKESPGVDDDKHNGVQLVDHHSPIPEHPNPAPNPPPGGWSSDPLMRAAQKIAYGHAGTDHIADFPGLTRDKLADLIYGKMRRSIDNPGGLRLGPSSSDGAPVIYDPDDNVLIVRDPSGADAGTVFKPNLQQDPNYVNDKFGGTVRSFQPGQLTDGPLTAPADPPARPPKPVEAPPQPPAAPGRPEPAPPPAKPPTEPAAPRPAPPRVGFGGGIGGGSGGGGLPGPALGPGHEPVE